MRAIGGGERDSANTSDAHADATMDVVGHVPDRSARAAEGLKVSLCVTSRNAQAGMAMPPWMPPGRLSYGKTV